MKDWRERVIASGWGNVQKALGGGSWKEVWAPRTRKGGKALRPCSWASQRYLAGHWQKQDAGLEQGPLLWTSTTFLTISFVLIRGIKEKKNNHRAFCASHLTIGMEVQNKAKCQPFASVENNIQLCGWYHSQLRNALKLLQIQTVFISIKDPQSSSYEKVNSWSPVGSLGKYQKKFHLNICHIPWT